MEVYIQAWYFYNKAGDQTTQGYGPDQAGVERLKLPDRETENIPTVEFRKAHLQYQPKIHSLLLRRPLRRYQGHTNCQQ